MNQSTETNQKVAKSGQCTWQGRPLKWEDADEEAVAAITEELKCLLTILQINNNNNDLDQNTNLGNGDGFIKFTDAQMLFECIGLTEQKPKSSEHLPYDILDMKSYRILKRLLDHLQQKNGQKTSENYQIRFLSSFGHSFTCDILKS